MGINLTKGDIKLLNIRYPELDYKIDEGLIIGDLHFTSRYEKCVEEISDCYSIEIDLTTLCEYGLPRVKETNGRILAIAEDKGVYFGDVHLNRKNGELCLILPPKIPERYPNGFELEEFMNHIEEHLYWVTYYDRFNKKPWAEYSHGVTGYVELYHENPKKYEAVVRKHPELNNRSKFRKTLKKYKKK